MPKPTDLLPENLDFNNLIQALEDFAKAMVLNEKELHVLTRMLKISRLIGIMESTPGLKSKISEHETNDNH